MATALFFSPCIPIRSDFFVVEVGGVNSFALVSIIYLIVTLAILLFMVPLGRKTNDRIQWHFLEHNENLITGIIFIILALSIFYI
jgi:hypothetical protein